MGLHQQRAATHYTARPLQQARISRIEAPLFAGAAAELGECSAGDAELVGRAYPGCGGLAAGHCSEGVRALGRGDGQDCGRDHRGPFCNALAHGCSLGQVPRGRSRPHAAEVS